MGESITAIVPVPRSNEEVAPQAEVQAVDLGFPHDAITKAAKEFGMVEFRPANLIAAHTLGEAYKRAGAIKSGRAYLGFAGEHTKFAANKCQEILRSTDDPELTAAITPNYLGFVKAAIEVGNSFIRSAEADGNDGADNKPRVKPFGAGQLAGPVNIVSQQTVVNNNTPQ